MYDIFTRVCSTRNRCVDGFYRTRETGWHSNASDERCSGDRLLPRYLPGLHHVRACTHYFGLMGIPLPDVVGRRSTPSLSNPFGGVRRHAINPQTSPSMGSRMSVCMPFRWSIATWGPVAVSLVWLLLIAQAQAQTVVDGSDRSLDPNDRALLLSVLKSRLPDPQSAQVRSIVQGRPGVYCGEVSTRGRDGELGEFTRFVVETKIRQVTVTPTTDPARIAMILRMVQERCRSKVGR